MGRGITKAGQEIKYLTVEDILLIHEVTMERYGGGESGIYKEGESKISSMLDRLKSGYFGLQPFDTLLKKTAFMFQYLLIYHPFVDGMKRTGIYSALAFLLKNGYVLTSTDVEGSVKFAISVADEMKEKDPEESIDEISNWFKKRTIPLNDSDALLNYLISKGKKFKCPRCKNPHVYINEPYCTDCGMQIIGFNVDFDGIVHKELVGFERKSEINPKLMKKSRYNSILPLKK